MSGEEDLILLVALCSIMYEERFDLKRDLYSVSYNKEGMLLKQTM